ncbi:MAG: hypothetical protein WBM50_08335 [Acidimicrobiales bacterium]
MERDLSLRRPCGSGMGLHINKERAVTRLIDSGDAPGTHQYICTIPGHAKLGMRGMFVVENPE